MNVEPASANPAVTGAIRHAARMTGADFKYLLATAQVESSLNPNAQVATSSARGLFQFIEQTWMSTLKEQGGALGYGRYANAIVRTPTGQYAVSDPRLYDKVMSLRDDPTANAVMAGAFTKSNAGKLAAALGRKASEGELYVAHFLGPNGAARLIGTAQTTPRANAVEMFPGAASSNPSIFFDRQGRPNGVGEVYRALINRYASARAVPAAAPEVPPVAMAKPPAMPTGPRPVLAPDLAQLANAYAAVAPQTPPLATFDGFNGLFRTEAARDEAVAPVVSALWGAPGSGQGAAPTMPTVLPDSSEVPTVSTAVPQPASKPTPLDLFQDQARDVRALFRGRV